MLSLSTDIIWKQKPQLDKGSGFLHVYSNVYLICMDFGCKKSLSLWRGSGFLLLLRWGVRRKTDVENVETGEKNKEKSNQEKSKAGKKQAGKNKAGGDGCKEKSGF